MSEQAKHTPGPWHLSRDGATIFAGTAGAGVLIRGMEQVIPHVAYIAKNGFAATVHEQRANANLIAAAPELLAACKELRHAIAVAFGVLGDHPAAWARFEDACEGCDVKPGIKARTDMLIAKAEGR